MKQTIAGLTVYNLTNEYQVYDGKKLVAHIWKCGDATIDRERFSIAIARLLGADYD